MLHQIHPNKIRQLLFISVLILLTYVIGREMYFLLGAFLGAITLYVLMRNYMIKLVLQFKWRKSLAAFLLIVVSLLAIVLPSIWLVSVALEKIKPLLQQPQMINQAFETIHNYLLANYQIDILNSENMAKLNGMVMPFVQQTIGSTLSSLANLFIMYFILFFMLTGTSDVELWLRNNVPFKNSNVQIVINEFRSMVYSNAVGIPIVAIVQGIAGLVGYWIFGTVEFVLMGILTAVCSVIPVVGSMLVYVPIGLYQIAIGNTFNGIATLLWGFILIGSIDNVARFMIQRRIANVHPLITIFGVIIGINMFGFLGIIFGPLLISMFVILVKVYIDEFGKADAENVIDLKRTNEL